KHSDKSNSSSNSSSDKFDQDDIHNPNGNSNSSASSASLNGSENGGSSFMSSASSMTSSTDKPPLHLKSRRVSAAALRKQMRDERRVELQHFKNAGLTSPEKKHAPKRHHSSPRVLMTPTSAARGEKAKLTTKPSKQRSQPLIATPVQRTRSLQRKTNHAEVSPTSTKSSTALYQHLKQNSAPLSGTC
ncbi:MAG: hypothetical protein SGARI_001558, partial [Bacillariaceae sp.]